jgi:N-acetyl-anhydromuramyl-L-alanine amidase AmpD
MDALIAGGRALATTCHVVGWQESGYQFRGLPTRATTRQLVLHWTGGSAPAPLVYRTLKSRTGKRGQRLNLSVHLCVEADGTVYQFADLDARCAHAGTVDDSDHDGHELSGNAQSVGIEIVNPAIPSDKPQDMTRGVLRQVLSEKIHEIEIRQTTFTQAQTTAVIELVRVICGHYSLPVAVPMEGDQPMARVMTEAEFSAFTGVCGHYHLTARKRDPGLALMRAVAALPLRGQERPAE